MVETTTASGLVATVATTLCEDQEWLRTLSSRAKWVDCEIGDMAKASNELGISFRFLHVVSDNLCTPGGDDLSDEDTPRVIEKRKPLYKEIVSILRVFLSQEASLPPDWNSKVIDIEFLCISIPVVAVIFI